MPSKSVVTAATSPVLLALLGFSNLTSPAYAETDANSSWSVGVAAAYSRAAYLGYREQFTPLPLISYRSNNWFFQGIRGGYQMVDTRTDDSPFGTTLDLELGWNSQSFDPQKSSILTSLDKRRSSIEAGFTWTSTQRFGQFSLQAATDISGRHNGQRAKFSYGFPLFFGNKLNAFGALSANWHSARRADYYYGVSTIEAERTGLSAYSAVDAIKPEVGIFMTYGVAVDWTLQAGLSREWLSNELKLSPMVDGIHKDGVFLGLSYRL